MIKPDWDIFKAKFSENPQRIFEWFCYLLFCKEFNKPSGVPGYQNHRHIETDPIEKNGEIIGWQAKFSELSLSDHKTEIITLIEGAKKDYPNISKIIFYTNRNWGQGKNQNDPKAKLEIDNKAKELGIEIDWNHLKNFFESPFVSVENELIAKYFFSPNNSILDFINDQQLHTENILSEIKTCIDFNGNHIEISRDEVLRKIRKQSSQTLILSGDSGVGKTALVKKFYEQLKTKTPFYVFKATEFELVNIKDFFVDCNLQEFIAAHKDQKNKIVVIDSAEKLLDLSNTGPFKEFLTVLIENDWNIIFTARTNYIEDLNYQFFEIYNVSPTFINLPILEEDELDSISSSHSFNLPENQKLLELIKNPFYLNEYLKFYRNDSTGLDYTEFKDSLWRRNIQKNDPSRAECFLIIALKRANQGSFFITPSCNSPALDKLEKDGMLGYEGNKGFFITHDVYEEWALEKKVGREYYNKENNRVFFEKLGQTLPIRRSLRNWISEKLLLQDQEIGNFIKETLTDEEIQTFWKDEVLVSILLSPYSDIFFSNFRNLLLDNNQKLLRKIASILIIACKKIDQDVFKKVGINKKIDLLESKYVLTKPKGQGWGNFIRFVYENLEDIGIENISFVLPVIHDWNINIKGETTKYSSLIALQYYESLLSTDSYFSLNNKEQILKTITFGAFEIKENLQKILEKVIENKWKRPEDPFYELSETILKKPEGLLVSSVLPELVLQLIDLFYLDVPNENDFYFPENIYSNFNPSPYQTPIYALLESFQKQTINFILEFTNKTVESFAKSDFAKNEVEEINVYIDETRTTKQYICDTLWCTYRGNFVSPGVLQSMHMALEKDFLERSPNISSKILEGWLLYLLRKSKSSSISAVVVSIVLAYPEKTFNVAKILFRTKEFFLYETKRLVLESEIKTLYSIPDTSNDPINEISRKERLKACNDEHRKETLENLFLNYQFFRSKETSEHEAEKRQKILWKILDDYYEKLPPESEQTDTDEIWRLFLARMDRRKMKPTTKETDKGFEINFNPQIDPKLKKKSERREKEISDGMKHIPLYRWSQYKWENNEQYKQYVQYEDKPKLVLKEVKKIHSKLKELQPDNKEDSSFFFHNYSIPAKACSILIRDYFNKLSKKEISFCKDVTLSAASSSLRPDYQYQISDGVEEAISVLPFLTRKFPEETQTIKIILLLTSLDPNRVGAVKDFSSHSINTVLNNLWEISFEDAQSILFGYLLIKPLYEQLRKKLLYEKSLKKGNYSLKSRPVSESEIVERFCEENKDYLERFLNNDLSMDDIKEIEELELHHLEKAFQLIPVKTNNEDHQKIVRKIVFIFAEKLHLDNLKNKIKYVVRVNFFRKLACFVLSRPKEEIKDYLKPFIDNFNSSEIFADLFRKFIIEQDRLKTYDNFWEVWNLFKEKVIEICRDGDNRGHRRKIIKSYLFARTPLEETITSWHTLRDNDKTFFKEISREIGHCPSVIYSVSELINGIGSHYLDDGMLWVSDMLTRNQNLLSDNLEESTIYHMEGFTKKYVRENLVNIKENKELKKQILVVLDFLISKDSVIGYMLRDRIV